MSSQRFTDKFLTTPGGGIQDAYAMVGTKTPATSVVPGIVLKAAYHQIFSEDDGSHYGNEWKVVAAKAFGAAHGKYVLALKYADYDGDEFTTNTRKLCLTLNFKLGPGPYRKWVRGK